ncbi:hypothetical protein Ami103574_13655 [Aminipila butyrica]|uniref:Uncharacterized protein n=1 Tax=Aminipila butyrica TaxID=433296 RepID=A0A858BXV3_9FIRM|nr:hypothetical protein [Aminipila butyrica]QIB70272.1 hypothetical protein Ami103574_13655 [Aminipila butyrica]
MEEKKYFYADVWGDTVDIRHLAIAAVIGIVVSLTLFSTAWHFMQTSLDGVAPNLIKAYALLVGILGSLISAAISAKLFKPKRILNEKHFAEEDQLQVLEELGLDRDKEREYLQKAESCIVEEMKSLKIYELFAGESQSGKEDV